MPTLPTFEDGIKSLVGYLKVYLGLVEDQPGLLAIDKVEVLAYGIGKSIHADNQMKLILVERGVRKLHEKGELPYPHFLAYVKGKFSRNNMDDLIQMCRLDDWFSVRKVHGNPREVVELWSLNPAKFGSRISSPYDSTDRSGEGSGVNP